MDDLHSLLSYDPETGALTWRVNRGHVKAGSEAGYVHSSGYRYVGVREGGKKRMVLAHRLIFRLMGQPLPVEVDHRNGNRSDNRWSNLRACSTTQNRQNQCRHRDSASSLKGVSYRKDRGNYRSQICVKGKRLRLGTFATEQEAHAAYVAAAKLHFGEFARAA